MSDDSPVVPAQGPGTGRTILVADGNTDAAESLALVLRLYGHPVETAFTGPDALALAVSSRPAAVILNLALPGLDGYEVARRLRDAGADGPAPVLIALTGYGRPEDRVRSLAAGFDHHVVKPADPRELIALLVPAAAATPP